MKHHIDSERSGKKTLMDTLAFLIKYLNENYPNTYNGTKKLNIAKQTKKNEQNQKNDKIQKGQTENEINKSREKKTIKKNKPDKTPIYKPINYDPIPFNLLTNKASTKLTQTDNYCQNDDPSLIRYELRLRDSYELVHYLTENRIKMNVISTWIRQMYKNVTQTQKKINKRKMLCQESENPLLYCEEAEKQILKPKRIQDNSSDKEKHKKYIPINKNQKTSAANYSETSENEELINFLFSDD